MSVTSSRDLSPDQRVAFDRMGSWLLSSTRTPILTLSGYAGCGKSTVLSVFVKESGVSPIAFVTYTGKAASVLRRKLADVGIHTTNVSPDDPDDATPFCGTIHSLIYAPVEIKRCMKCKKEQSGNEKTCTNTQSDGTVCKGTFRGTGRVQGWRKRESLDRPYELIALDEGSMVSDEILSDLRNYNIPILAVGDHGQLPPINGMGSLMRNPDIRLEKIHRQAEGNPIIRLSKIIRETGRLDIRSGDGKFVVFRRLNELPKIIEDRYRSVTTQSMFDLSMICYTNKRRVALNMMARQARGFSGPPKTGDQVICLRNQNGRGVYNGMRAILLSDAERRPGEHQWKMFSKLDFVEDNIRDEFSMCIAQFNRDYTFRDFDELAERNICVNDWGEVGGLFDFGVAITGHKSQGSQFSDVLLIVDGPGRMGADEYRRWLYTSATRSSERLTIVG